MADGPSHETPREPEFVRDANNNFQLTPAAEQTLINQHEAPIERAPKGSNWFTRMRWPGRIATVLGIAGAATAIVWPYKGSETTIEQPSQGSDKAASAPGNTESNPHIETAPRVEVISNDEARNYIIQFASEINKKVLSETPAESTSEYPGQTLYTRTINAKNELGKSSSHYSIFIDAPSKPFDDPDIIATQPDVDNLSSFGVSSNVTDSEYGDQDTVACVEFKSNKNDSTVTFRYLEDGIVKTVHFSTKPDAVEKADSDIVRTWNKDAFPKIQEASNKIGEAATRGDSIKLIDFNLS